MTRTPALPCAGKELCREEWHMLLAAMSAGRRMRSTQRAARGAWLGQAEKTVLVLPDCPPRRAVQPTSTSAVN